MPQKYIVVAVVVVVAAAAATNIRICKPRITNTVHIREKYDSQYTNYDSLNATLPHHKTFHII